MREWSDRNKGTRTQKRKMSSLRGQMESGVSRRRTAVRAKTTREWGRVKERMKQRRSNRELNALAVCKFLWEIQNLGETWFVSHKTLKGEGVWSKRLWWSLCGLSFKGKQGQKCGKYWGWAFNWSETAPSGWTRKGEERMFQGIPRT